MPTLKEQAEEILAAQNINWDSALDEFYQEIIKKQGLPFKKRPAKAQHRWKKALAEIPFYVDYQGAKAEIYYVTRNQMLIKQGAKLVTEVPLNKDGSLGFGQRFALTLREEHENAIDNFVTTADITLKSPNEVGHFLYFAGTDSWKVIKDQDGKTLDEYTRV